MDEAGDHLTAILVYCDDHHPRHDIGQLGPADDGSWWLTFPDVQMRQWPHVKRMVQPDTEGQAGQRLRITCHHCGSRNRLVGTGPKLWDCLQRLRDGGVRELRLRELHAAMRLANAVR